MRAYLQCWLTRCEPIDFGLRHCSSFRLILVASHEYCPLHIAYTGFSFLPFCDAFEHHLQFGWNLCEELKKFLSSGLMYLLLAHSKAVFVCGCLSADRAQILQQSTLCWSLWLKWVDMYNVVGLEYSRHHDYMLPVLMNGLTHFCQSKLTMGNLNLQNPHSHFCHSWNGTTVKGFVLYSWCLHRRLLLRIS